MMTAYKYTDSVLNVLLYKWDFDFIRMSKRTDFSIYFRVLNGETHIESIK